MKRADMFALVMVAGCIVALTAVLTGCGPEQGQPSQKPSDGLGAAVQASPWVDPRCYVEGRLVAVECNELGAWPPCPAEDEWRHDGQPCFWVDPNGRGLLWSDGARAADER